MTAPGRSRSVLRASFHLQDHPAPEVALGRIGDLVEDITPVHQTDPATLSVDLDITGALRHFDRGPRDMAAILQIRVLALYGVNSTIGGGPSPMIASMAACVTPPGGITVIGGDDDAVAAFLHPRPVAALPGVGPATARTPARFGITTIGDLAATSTGTLTRLLGAHAARDLSVRAHGVDPRPVQREALTRSIAAGQDFGVDSLDADHHRAVLLALADELGARLRTHDEVCQGLTLTVRYADRTHTTRTRRLTGPTAHSPRLAGLAHRLYDQLGLQRARVRQLTLRADGLSPRGRRPPTAAPRHGRRPGPPARGDRGHRPGALR